LFVVRLAPGGAVGHGTLRKSRRGRHASASLADTKTADRLTLAASMPCDRCAEAIRRAGVARVFYSTDGGTIQMVKSSELVSSLSKPTFNDVNRCAA
jgi:hypothetical protein